MTTKKLFIVIAAYNEAKRIHKILKELKKEYSNIIVIDDGSRDNTSEVSEKQGVTVLKHVVNMGKGAAMKTGCDYAIKNKAEIIILMDADGQHLPRDVPRFIKALEGNDIVFGYRKFEKDMPFILKCGNKFINFVTYLLFELKIKDTQSGFRAITAQAYKKIRWKSTSYSVESEMVANVGKKRLRYVEIPIQTIYSSRYKGTTVFDGIKIVLNMVIWKLRR